MAFEPSKVTRMLTVLMVFVGSSATVAVRAEVAPAVLVAVTHFSTIAEAPE